MMLTATKMSIRMGGWRRGGHETIKRRTRLLQELFRTRCAVQYFVIIIRVRVLVLVLVIVQVRVCTTRTRTSTSYRNPYRLIPYLTTTSTDIVRTLRYGIIFIQYNNIIIIIIVLVLVVFEYEFEYEYVLVWYDRTNNSLLRYTEALIINLRISIA